MRQNLTVPTDSWFEKELERELNIEKHEELKERVEAMSDSEFFTLLEKIIRRRRGLLKLREEGEEKVEVQYVT